MQFDSLKPQTRSLFLHQRMNQENQFSNLKLTKQFRLTFI